MKELLIQRVVSMLFDLFGPDELKEYIDDLIDKVENQYQDGSGGAKGFAVMTLCNTLRAVLSIPDDIGGDAD